MSILFILRSLRGGRVYSLAMLTALINAALDKDTYSSDQVGDQARKARSCLKKVGRGKYVTKGRVVKS